MTATVQTPFLNLCDTTMGVNSRMNILLLIKIDFLQYHLPLRMRLLEASHVVDILCKAGPAGLDVRSGSISEKNGVSPSKLG
jgi:hypothetical protein